MAINRASLLLVVAFVACIALLPYLASAQGWGQPLFLSNYLPNNAAKARELAAVGPLPGWSQNAGYAGYLTVNQTTFSNMFFWFFPALNNDTNAPVLLWLQGGPGGASMFGLFSENGPFSVSVDAKTVVPREYTWNKKYAMLYIDNPVGAGYSFTSSNDGFVRSETDVARDLYSALSQFFLVFPEYAKNDFYVTGESYAGKYVPAISYKIHEENQNPKNRKINLKGLAIGDGATDPLIMFTQYSELLYWLGLADENEVKVIQEYEQRIREGIINHKLVDAFRAFDEFLNGDFYPYPTYYTNITGTTNYFNFNDPIYPPNPYPQFLQQNSTRSKIHVGGYGYADYNASVEAHLLDDWMVSMAPVMPALLDNYKVMTYNGQYDIILGAPAAEKFYRTIPWKGQDEYRKAQKKVWTPAGTKTVAGYVRSVRNYRQVVVLASGHMVPMDQPLAAYDMITRFVDGVPF